MFWAGLLAKRSSSDASWLQKGGLGFQEVDQAWNGGRWTCKATPTLKSIKVGLNCECGHSLIRSGPNHDGTYINKDLNNNLICKSLGIARGKEKATQQAKTWIILQRQ
ncbi:hypothetical protein PIB30_006230 [Stylosanthes scabra]|uniref:Uncharacterized protein n=1 Tax=Stylosanthes scabra TaxID=79078 RepID=A0ABU6Z3X2_9FABA|nr:hypothetical protein [Stylosanthes scabra]